MKYIYLLTANIYEEYSDHSSWNVAAYEKEEDALRAKEEAEKEYEDYSSLQNAEWEAYRKRLSACTSDDENEQLSKEYIAKYDELKSLLIIDPEASGAPSVENIEYEIQKLEVR